MTQVKKKDDRISHIQSNLASGRTREEIAKKLGYSSWRSLDMFMRRKGMKWDHKQQNYYYPQPENEEMDSIVKNMSSKVSKIISMFNKRDTDPKEVARKAGFTDHRELASYMKARGFIWSYEINNYVVELSEDPEASGKKEKVGIIFEEAGNNEAEAPERKSIYTYVPLLEEIAKNWESIHNLITPGVYAIPRYVVPGITRTKSFYMSDRLSNLLNEFSKSKNISQKEIIEAAIIEFLRKYSFKKEVDDLLKKY